MAEVKEIDGSNRGIPTSEVIEDVAGWLTKEKLSPEEAELVLREKYRKYKYVENNMTLSRERMSEKLPEFKNSLAILEVMLEKRDKEEPFETTFLLSDDVYSRAIVNKPDKVSIWLGANVMVEYELDKAKALLEKNQSSVQKLVDDLTAELAFIKDQITTTEVNMAHIINYRVMLNKTKGDAK
ncbi:unnamed protein product [Caenorhabditis auriculariae]|uniref:Prefoldin subunit 3 n=1 Tax=Caenorhabditis auriculariae TaxID=2777116 RepID=A0A8S1HRB6_9PELO|nr:unnamed protein product [Caenorhabditis auriculariae]